MKIGIVGLGYIGLSLSLVLSQEHEVVALDLDEKIDKLNKRISPTMTRMKMIFAQKNSI